MMQEKYIKQIAGYKLTDRLLGAGSFSQVLKAYATDHQPLAVKIIPRCQILQSDIAGFESEVGILQSLRHKNIAKLVDFRKTQNNFYLFLEYCEGGNLAEYIRTRRKLPEPEAIKIFGQIIRGLAAMHHSKVMHRDLKPSNIILHNGTVKIADFGLACKFSKDQMLRTFAGTPLYMAPEILKGHVYNQKVDIYSAGNVLYEMLYGVTPFKGRDLKTLLESIEQGQLAATDAEVSERTKAVLRQMLQCEPQNRMDLTQLQDFLCDYELEEKEKRLKEYRKLCDASIKNLGATGALCSRFNMGQCQPNRPLEMDMRLYNKLCRRLSPQLAV